jgi:hypothetical protein
MDVAIAAIRRRLPDFTRRAMTFEDFLVIAAHEQLTVEVKPYPMDEHLVRRPLARIVLNAGLAERYRTFMGFHALGHWFLHPATQEFYLKSPGWLDRVELEASAIGYLALAPYRDGPPWPRLVKAVRTELQMDFFVEYPEQIPGRKLRWKPRRSTLVRLHQMDLPFQGQGELL